MPGRKIRLSSGSSLIIIGTSLASPSSKTIKGNCILLTNFINEKRKKRSNPQYS